MNRNTMNPYIKHLDRIEFLITLACTGRCRHCSEGDHAGCGVSLDGAAAASLVTRVAENFPIESLMTFGGEPMLHPEAVYAIHRAGRDAGIPKRQVITNGFFSRDAVKIRTAAEMLVRSGVNDILLSADAFHQETIPLDVVKQFASEAEKCGIPIRLQPAWLVSATDDNPYNRKTREILGSFADVKIPVGEGNVIFPEGNALRYLAEYFTDTLPENPYAEDPRDVRCVSFEPNGDVLGGNVYRNDIMEIIKDYAP